MTYQEILDRLLTTSQEQLEQHAHILIDIPSGKYIHQKDISITGLFNFNGDLVFRKET